MDRGYGFCLPQPVLDAMKARLDRRILGYSMILDPEYFAALAGWMADRHGWKADPRPEPVQLGRGAGAGGGGAHAHRACRRRLLNTPAYHPFDDAIKKMAAPRVYSRLVVGKRPV